MRKSLKYLVLALLSLVAFALLLAAYLALTFNPNDYKDDIIKLVKEKKNRHLNIEGDIQLAFWPKIGADLGKVSLSEFNSNQTFASVQKLKVSLAVLPLLNKSLVIDQVYIDGAKVNVIKHKSGRFNFDDLLSKDEESPQFKFDIDGVNLTNSDISYTDESNDTNYLVSKLNLHTGRIAIAQPVDLKTDFLISSNQPIVLGKVNLAGHFLIDPKTKHFKVKKLNSQFVGNMLSGKKMHIALRGNVEAKPEQFTFLLDDANLVASGEFSGARQSIDLIAPKLQILKNEASGQQIYVVLSQRKNGETIKANLRLADMKGSPKALQSSGIAGDFSVLQGNRTIAGKFSSPFSGNLETLLFELPKLTGNVEIKDPNLPNGGAKGTFELVGKTEFKKELVYSKLNINIEGVSKLVGEIDVAGFEKSNIKFNLKADKIDLNQLLTKNIAPAKTANTSSKAADFNTLKGKKISGKLQIGNLNYQQYQLTGLNVAINSDGEKLMLSGLNVKLDESQVKGNLGVSQYAKPLYHFDLDIDQINVDRYLPKNTQSNTKNTNEKVTKPTEMKVPDLSPLKVLNAQGAIRVGKLKYGNTNASNIQINLKADAPKPAANAI